MPWKLPNRPTAPFCPSAVQGVVTVPSTESHWRKLLAFVGPGLLVSVGYMDPGNWATDIEGGSRFGYSLLTVIFTIKFDGDRAASPVRPLRISHR